MFLSSIIGFLMGCFVCDNRFLAGRRGAVPYRLVVYTQKFVAFRTVGDAGPYNQI